MDHYLHQLYKYQLNGLKTYTHPKIIKLTEKQKESFLTLVLAMFSGYDTESTGQQKKN